MTFPGDDATPAAEAKPSRKSGGLLKNSARALFLRVGLMVVNLATALMLARWLGPEQYGVYVFIVAVLSLVALPGQAGMPLINVREISFRLVDRDWPRVLGIIVRTRQMMLLYSLAMGVCIALAYMLYLDDRMSAPEGQALLWVAVLMPAFILLPVTGASLRALNHLFLGQLIETLVRPAAFLALVALVFFVSKDTLDASDAMMLHAIAALAMLALALFLQHRIVGPNTAGLAPVYDTREILSSLAPLTLVAGMQIIIGKTDILMLRYFRSPEEVAYYNVALQWAGLALIARQAVLMVTGPSVARAFQRGDLASVQRTLTSSARLIFVGALPLGLALLFFGEWIVLVSFGPEYVPAVAALSILVIGRIIQASYGVVIQLAKMAGWESLMFWLVAFAALLNVILNAVLIPGFGTSGAAIASILASFVWKTTLMVLAWRRLGLVSFLFGGRPETLPNGKDAAQPAGEKT